MSAATLFEALARRAPTDPVLVADDRTWNAADVIAAAEGLAPVLRDSRVVAVLADNGPAWALADLGALASGHVHLPLPSFFSASQLVHALTVAGADSLLTDQPLRVDELALGFCAEGTWNGLTLMRRKAERVGLPAATAKISFTSGSTGNPKGVCLSAEGLLDTATAVVERLADLPIAHHLAVLPLGLLLENVAGLHVPLLRGAAVHLPSLQALGWRGMAGFDPAALHARAGASQAHSLILVPELLKAWVAYLNATGQRAPGALTYVAVGGARVDAGLLARARALGIPAYQGYGLTECGSVVCVNRPDDESDGVGRPLAHAAVKVVEGEVRVGTRAFLGYLGDNPAAKATHGGEGFPTGDLGRLDADGHLHLSGRRSNLIITAYGRNISPEWVESALLARAAIAQVVVAGDARADLCAVVVAAPGADGEAVAAAVERANATLPDYARIRRWISVAPFSVRNGQATGNGRAIRAAILKHHAAAITALYPEEESERVVL